MGRPGDAPPAVAGDGLRPAPNSERGLRPALNSERGLRPALNVTDTMLLVMGGIVGAGIFFSPHRVAEAQPGLGGILVTWLLGGLIAMTGAFVFAELGGLFPHTGGQYVYLREAYGKDLAFLYGWNLLAMVSSGAIAVVAGVCLFNLDLVLQLVAGRGEGRVLGPHGQAISGTALILVLAALNVRGVKLGARVHNAFMVLKVAGLLLVIALGAWSLSGGGGASAPSGLAAGPWTVVPAALAPALLAALFSYGGWQNVASVAGEVRDAPRVLPRAIVLGTSAVIALYLGVNLSVAEILGVEGLGATRTPVADAAGAVLGAWGRTVIAGVVVVSTVGITHALLIMPPRIYYAMAHDGTFLRACGRSHARWATPHAAILLQAAFAAAHFLAATYLTEAYRYDLETVLESIVFVDWISFALAGGAYFLFRRRLRDAPRPYRAPLHPWVPLVFLVTSAAVVVETVRVLEPGRLAVPAAVLAAGGLFLAARRVARRGG
ncbi:MAG: APC family permease [Planctomycetes bacterium]|nr:APC family permease [Planctomycetota bacterium]